MRIRPKFFQWIAAFGLLVFFAPQSVFAFTCPELLARFLYHAQRGSLGINEDPVAEHRDTAPAHLRTHPAMQQISDLEFDIIDIFRVAPEFRDLEAFERKWNLSHDEALDILTFYGTRAFYDDAEIAGNPVEIFSRLRTVSREHYLGDAQDSLARSYLFYAANLSQLSVPELARLKGISENQVYEDLSMLGLSIPEAFGSRLKTAQDRFASGEDLGTIARDLGLGRQALEFVLHHTGDRNRGVEWNRIANFEGHPELEISILVKLKLRGFTHQEIADRLNVLFGTTVPTLPEIRTEQSVKQKLADLGLSEPRATTVPRVFLSEYGLLKDHGKLVPVAATRFIMEHFRMSDEWLAEQLAVTPAGLKDFMKRHHIIRRNGRMEIERSALAQKQLAQYERQRRAIRLVLDWMHTHGGKIPVMDDFGTTNGLGVSGDAFFGTGVYRTGKANEKSRIFESREAAQVALRTAAAAEGIHLKYFDFSWPDGIPDKLRPEVQREAIGIVLDWMEVHDGKVPNATDFGASPGQVGINAPQFFGTSKYKLGEKWEKSRIFDSREHAMGALKAAADARGKPIRYLDMGWRGEVPAAIGETMKKEAVDLVLEWMKKNPGRFPSHEDFGTTEGKVGIPSSKFWGMGSYDSTSSQSHRAIFTNREESIKTIKAAADLAGVPFHYHWLSWKDTGIPEEFRPLVQAETVQLVVDWIQKNGRPPIQTDFGLKPGEIPISYAAFVGNSDYGEGRRNRKSRIFDSPEEAWFSVKEAATKASVPLRLLDIRIRETPSERLRAEIQTEAIRAFLDWTKANGRVPETPDFGIESEKVGVNAYQFFGQSAYAIGNANGHHRIFDSKEQAVTAIRAQAAKEGIPIRYIDFSFKGGYSSAIRPEVRKEGAQILLSWVMTNGRFPASKEFGADSSKVGLTAGAALATGAYGPGGHQYENRIFDSREDALQAVRDEAARQKITLPAGLE